MTNPKRPGPLRRVLAALGRTLGRAILGKASPTHMRQFAAGDEYWKNVVAAQSGWPRELTARPGVRRSNTLGPTDQSSAPGDQRTPELATSLYTGGPSGSSTTSWPATPATGRPTKPN
jgi:hypothetical protein